MALKEEQHVHLKEQVVAKFGIQIENVVVVGSAKLGFSIKPGRRYGLFSNSSDIDLALVSGVLFERVWKEIFDFESSGAYWPKKEEFANYLFRGWIRPDMLPSGKGFEFTNTWWAFFQQITASRQFGPYKIRGALYHAWHFFEAFQRICIDQCKQQAEPLHENIGHK